MTILRDLFSALALLAFLSAVSLWGEALGRW